VASRLAPEIDSVVLGWPGFGDEPPDDSVTCLTDLAGYVLMHMNGPCDLIAQSMGGIIALSLALEHPERVRRIVLTGTSGGIDVSRFGAEEWRFQTQPDANDPEQTPTWFIDDRTDLTDDIPGISAPTLLIWGRDDRMSPPAAGEYLASLMPHARFEVVPGGHDHPALHPEASARLIEAFLLDPTPSLSRAG
jgi:pimeloyl-ACP methyl ester carboxylesterase